MMRLIGPWLFVFVGLVVGLATTRLFGSNPLRFFPNAVLGVVGSFFGLFVRDVLDIAWGGNLGGAFVAAVIGAVALTVIGNLAYNALFLKRGYP